MEIKYDIMNYIPITCNCVFFTESHEMQVSYKGLSKVPNKDWGEVLTKLSNRGKWTAIRYLVLGITFGFRDGEFNTVTLSKPSIDTV